MRESFLQPFDKIDFQAEGIPDDITPFENFEGGAIWRILNFRQRAAVSYWVGMISQSQNNREVFEYVCSNIGSAKNDWKHNTNAHQLALKIREHYKLDLQEKYYISCWFVWYGFPPIIAALETAQPEAITRQQADQLNKIRNVRAAIPAGFDYNEKTGEQIFVLHSRMNSED